MAPGPLRSRTTHGWLRVPVLVALAALAFVFASAFLNTKDDFGGTWVRRYPAIHWLAGWSMFTNRNRSQVAVDGFVRDSPEGDWERIRLGTYFPARWESGLRFDRSGFRNSRSRMQVVAASLCGRMAADPDVAQPQAVKFVKVSWKKTLGQQKQPRRKHVKKTELLVWECEREARQRHKGVRL